MTVNATNAVQHRRSRRGGFVDVKAALPPLNIPNLAGWWDADTIVGKNDGDAVAQWDDLSGNGKHFVQAGGGAQPLYKVNQIAGKPAVLYDGVDDGMTSTLSVTSGGMTVFLVWASNSAGNRRPLQGSNNWLMGVNNSGTYTYSNGAFISGGTASVGAWHYMSITQSASGGTMWLDGRVIGNNASTTYPGTFTMGFGGAVVESADSYIAEAIVYTRELTGTERMTVETYLRFKYAL